VLHGRGIIILGDRLEIRMKVDLVRAEEDPVVEPMDILPSSWEDPAKLAQSYHH
jgi:hypothetical protein